MTTIQPIVEGHGDREAVPVLLRRLIGEAQLFGYVDVGTPIRRRRPELVREEPFRRALKLARKQPDCGAILVVFDSDDDCPKELAPELKRWADAEVGDCPCEVVMPHREYEAWFLAAIRSLRGRRGIREDAGPHPSPETVRGAKEELERSMNRGWAYHEPTDQPALAAVFDMAAAYRCRSYRHLVTAFGRLAAGVGHPIPDWPPASWRT